MGHILPYAFAAQGSLILTLEAAVERILALLYKGLPLPQKPKSGKTPRKNHRTDEMKAKYAEGVSVRDLAAEYRISINRVYQIHGDKRK